MIIRIRSRDGLERVTLPDSSAATLGDLRSSIEFQLGVPFSSQLLSRDQSLLLSKSQQQSLSLSDLSSIQDLSLPLSSLNLSHGSVVYLSYPEPINRKVVGPTTKVTPAGSFGKKMTVDDLIARQMRVTRQENPHCSSVSFDRDSAHRFQLYVAETLAFAVKRGGFLYGSVNDDKSVSVQFIYEPPQHGTEESLALLRDPQEEDLVDAIAIGLGLRRVGFIFTQAVTRQGKGEWTVSAEEVLQAVELQAEGGIEEWVTAICKLEVAEDGAADVHFEAFQLSDTCVKMFKEGWFETEGIEENPKVSKTKKDVVVGGKDVREVDNDFFLVPVRISDHQGPLSSSFPVENRITTVTLQALKDHLNKTKHASFVKRISDFHLLLFLARYLDVKSDVPALAECVQKQATVPEGYQLLIESLAAAA